MIGYDTYEPTKLKDCITKVIVTKDCPDWIIKKYLEYNIQPSIHNLTGKWEKNYGK